MKICFVLGHFPPHIGGVEKLFLDLAKGMKNNGHEVRVITSASGGIEGYYLYEGIPVYYYKWKILFGHPILKKQDIVKHIIWADLIHTTTFTPAPIACKLAHKYNKKILITVHEALSEKWYWIEKNKAKAFLFKTFEKYVITRKYDYYHAISYATLEDIKKLKISAPIQAIYLSVEKIEKRQSDYIESIYKFFHIEKDKKIFLYYGRPGQSKGIFIYLKAINLLKKICNDKIENARFCFIMSDDPKAQKEKFCSIIKKNDLEDYIKIKSPVERKQLFEFIMQANYIVVPSITEGFGFSAVEACSMNKKLICSDAGSLPEVVFGEVISFKNRDAAELAHIIKSILEEKENFKIIPKKEFLLENTINQIEDLYKNLYKPQRSKLTK